MMNNFNEIPRKNPFKVPENYFEEVNRKIITVTSGYGDSGRKPAVIIRLKPYLLAAASIALLAIISYTTLRILAKEREEVLYPVSMTDPIINDIDLFTLEESAGDFDLSGGLAGVRKSEIIDYLMNENIEIDDIIEKF